MRTTLLLGVALCALVSCARNSEATEEVGASLNAKRDVAIADVPEGARAAARAARPDLSFTEAEYEAKNGTEYYEVAGSDANGEEIELDIMREGDAWRVVEVQRDITLDEAPAPVREALLAAQPDIQPARIIESDQTDGVVIYEVYTRDASGAEAKVEVKYEGGAAEVLTEEWSH